jgi:hypothetical protein
MAYIRSTSWILWHQSCMRHEGLVFEACGDSDSVWHGKLEKVVAEHSHSEVCIRMDSGTFGAEVEVVVVERREVHRRTTASESQTLLC